MVEIYSKLAKFMSITRIKTLALLLEMQMVLLANSFSNWNGIGTSKSEKNRLSFKWRFYCDVHKNNRNERHQVVLTKHMSSFYILKSFDSNHIYSWFHINYFYILLTSNHRLKKVEFTSHLQLNFKLCK